MNKAFLRSVAVLLAGVLLYDSSWALALPATTITRHRASFANSYITQALSPAAENFDTPFQVNESVQLRRGIFAQWRNAWGTKVSAWKLVLQHSFLFIASLGMIGGIPDVSDGFSSSPNRINIPSLGIKLDLGKLVNVTDVQVEEQLGTHSVVLIRRSTGARLTVVLNEPVTEVATVGLKKARESVAYSTIKIGSYAYVVNAASVDLTNDWLGNDQLLSWAGQTAQTMSSRGGIRYGGDRQRYLFNMINDPPSRIIPAVSSSRLASEVPGSEPIDEARAYLERTVYSAKMGKTERVVYLHYLSVLFRSRVDDRERAYPLVIEDRLLATAKLTEAAVVDDKYFPIVEEIMWSAGALVVRGHSSEAVPFADLTGEEEKALKLKTPFEINKSEDFERLCQVFEEAMRRGTIQPYVVINIKNFAPEAYLAYMHDLEHLSNKYNGMVTFIVSVEKGGTLAHDLPGASTALRKTADAFGEDFFGREYVAVITDGGSKTRGGPPTNANGGYFSLAPLVRVVKKLVNGHQQGEYQVTTFLNMNLLTLGSAWLQMKDLGKDVLIWPASDGIIEFGRRPGFGINTLKNLPSRFLAASGPKVELFPVRVAKLMQRDAQEHHLSLSDSIEDEMKWRKFYAAQRLGLWSGKERDQFIKELDADESSLQKTVGDRIKKSGSDLDVTAEISRIQKIQEAVNSDLGAIPDGVRHQFRVRWEKELHKAKAAFDEYKLGDKGNFTAKESGDLNPFVEKPGFGMLAERVIVDGDGTDIMNIFFVMGDKKTIWDLFVIRFNEIRDNDQRIGQQIVSVFDTVFGGVTTQNKKDPRSKAALDYTAEQGTLRWLGVHYGEEGKAGDIGNLDLNAQMFQQAVMEQDVPTEARFDWNLIPPRVHIHYKGSTDMTYRELKRGEYPPGIFAAIKNTRMDVSDEAEHHIHLTEGSGMLNTILHFGSGEEELNDLNLTPHSIIVDSEISAPVDFLGESGAVLQSLRHTPRDPETRDTYDLQERGGETLNVFEKTVRLRVYGGETTVSLLMKMKNGKIKNVISRAWNYDYKAGIGTVALALHEKVSIDEAEGMPISKKQEAFGLLRHVHPKLLGIKGISTWEDSDQGKKSLYTLVLQGDYAFEDAKTAILVRNMRAWLARVRGYSRPHRDLFGLLSSS